MTSGNAETAIRLLGAAAENHDRIAALPDSAKPGTIAEALAMQAQLVARIGKPVGGWKVVTDPSGVAMWGAIFAEDILPSTATVECAPYLPLGVEGEIAFRLDVDLPQRADPYSRAEIEAAVTALPAIEIVSTRFTSYQDTPILDRLVDRMSNGALITGEPRPDWREFDLSTLRVTLNCDGADLLDRIGGHARLDPVLPVIDFVHAIQPHKALKAGDIITAGTVTDLRFAKPGQHFAVEFHGFGRIELAFAEASLPS
jgi:2-keto-4-pentenoate hydratase